MKTTVFSTSAAFVRKQTIKDLRATDVSGYAHAMQMHAWIESSIRHSV